MQKNFKENLVRVVAVLGLIAVLLLGAWGIIQLAFFIPTLFSGAGNATPAVTSTSTVSTPAPTVTPAQTTPAATAPTTTKKTTTVKKAATSKSAATYVASGRTQNLYGQPDLIVRIAYAVPNYNTGRTAVEFTVENIGTNAAPYGWSFAANIPFNGQYSYDSGAQQKLYPGDKIVYLLGYQNDYSNYGYANPVYPGACVSYNTPGCMGSGAGYGYTNYSGYQNYNQYGYQGRTVSIQVDQIGLVYENNEGNNTASASY